MEIYTQSKNRFNKNEERKRYNYTFNEFNNLKILGKDSNIDLLENNLKENIINSVYKYSYRLMLNLILYKLILILILMIVIMNIIIMIKIY